MCVFYCRKVGNGRSTYSNEVFELCDEADVDVELNDERNGPSFYFQEMNGSAPREYARAMVLNGILSYPKYNSRYDSEFKGLSSSETLSYV